MTSKLKPLIYIAYANKPKQHLTALESEFMEVRSILRRKEGNNFELLWDEVATIEKMSEALQGDEHQRLEFFAYSGHANSGTLELSEEDAYIGGLAGMMGHCQNLKVVLLNGCSTVGMVKAILEQGVKVVIATHAPVNDNTAKVFAIAFFKRLAKNNCELKDAFEAAKNRVLTERKDTEFLTTRGLVIRKDVRQPLWGIFYEEENEKYLRWKLPTVQVWLHPSLALAPSQLGGEEKSLLAMVLNEKDLEELPEMPRWQEASQPANLCLLWGVCRHPFLGFYLALEEGESLQRLHETLAWSEVLFYEHCNHQLTTSSICWLQMDISSIPAPRNDETFGQLLNEQENALAKALSAGIQDFGKKPPGIRIGIITKANKDFQWSYIEEWVNRFPDFSFVVVLTKDDLQHDLNKKLKSLLVQQSELNRECFFVLEKPNYLPSPSLATEVSDDDRFFAEKMGSIILETDSEEKSSVKKFVETHHELMGKGNLSELVRFERLFLPQILERQPESNLPIWVQACLELGNEVVHEKLFQHIGEFSARWDAFVLAAKHNESWLRLAAEDYARQPNLYLALLRRASRFPDEREKIFDLAHQFLNGDNCASTCEEIKELFEILRTNSPVLLSEHLADASLSQWICFSKSGANLPHAYFSTQSGQLRSRQPDFWWRIFRLPLRASLLMEIQALDADKKELFWRIGEEKNTEAAQSFSQKARRSLIVKRT